MAKNRERISTGWGKDYFKLGGFLPKSGTISLNAIVRFAKKYHFNIIQNCLYLLSKKQPHKKAPTKLMAGATILNQLKLVLEIQS